MLPPKQLYHWLLPGIAVLLLAGGFVMGRVAYDLAQPVTANATTQVIITVKPGMSTQEIGEMLYEKGLIKNVMLFRLIAKLEGMEKSLQAAEYAFSPNMTVRQIVGMLAKGETAYRQFTIPEGFTIAQIAALLEEKNLASSARFKEAARALAPYDYMEAKPQVAYRAEGFVFPDTYRVARGITEEQLLRMMIYQFNEQLTPELRQRARELGLSIYQVITLASLVEKEAKVEAERPVIAGVFLSRLQKEMPLQSCATIQYILGYPKPELTVADTEIPSAFNTYQNLGLPPGPIANPGIESIRAVLYPANTDYLYFVADKNGAHQFSKTYAEHLAAIARVGD